MSFIITRVGSTLKCVDSGGDVTFFTSPTIKLIAAPIYPTVPAACVEISQGTRTIQLTVALLTTLNGVTGATLATLAAIADALIAVPSGNTSVQTAATGTNYTAFTSQACTSLTLFNNTGTALDVQQGGTGAAISIPAGASFTFVGITNASQLGVRRTDTTNTQVTAGARWQA